MSNYIIKKLTNLRKVLDSMGYTRESNYIYQLTKTAVPLLDVLPLDEAKPAPLFEDRDAWSKSIRRIKANVIAIPFDEDALSREDKKKIMSIWGFKGGTFKDFKNKISLITPPTDEHSLRKNHKVARVEKLESQFPELWRRISPILSGAKLDKNEAVYVLYNTKVPEGDVAGLQFIKTPRYFAHDLGHWTYDFSFKDEGDEWTPKDAAMLKSRMIFKNKIEDFMHNISKFYVDENGKSPRLDEPHLDLFFDNATSPVEGDKYSDVFANAASEEGILSTYKSPKEILVNGKRYALREKGSLEKESLEQNFFREMNDYVSASEGGPLTDTFGQVIFYDIV